MKIVYLRPYSGYLSEFRSDTLFGLICWGIRSVYGNQELENLLDSFYSGQPSFTISSTFPYQKIGEKYIQYFPKPILPALPFAKRSESLKISEVLEKSSLDKINKKKLFIPFEQFQNLINGDCSIEEALSYSNNIKVESVSITHNTIDRLRGATLQKEGVGQLFHKDEHFIKTGSESIRSEAGLFFLVQGDTEKIAGALRWLSHSGFGGDRNTGKGQFSFEIKSFEIQQPIVYNAVTNMSLYFPSKRKDELAEFKFSPFFNYKIEQRQGYLGYFKYKNVYKPATTMFSEGSVFPRINKAESYGALLRLKEKNESAGLPHNIYQYGFGFMIKLKILNNGSSF